MTKNACCCPGGGGPPSQESFCCRPEFFTDFITLYGDTLAEHAEVSPDDWIALYVRRDRTQTTNFIASSFVTPLTIACKCQAFCEGSSEKYWARTLESCGTEEECAALAREVCCNNFMEGISVPGAEPIYFAYKYSGCKFIWYPREFSFNYDPNIPQCNGFKHSSTGNPNYSASCWNWVDLVPMRGAGLFDVANPNTECENQFVTTTVAEGSGNNPLFPCSCSPHPHLHGGVTDSIYNRPNIRLNPGSLGYLPYMLPFSPPMTEEEAGCCWCANNAIYPTKQLVKLKAQCYLSLYPKSDGYGKTIIQNNPCSPGAHCRDTGDLSNNPGYTTNCFRRGISPYLLRISKTDYKMAYEMWGFGQTPETTMDFGTIFKARDVEVKSLTKDIDISFKRESGTRAKLKDVYIGTVHLEHHFEMYAYRSDSGSATIEMMSLQNNCNAIVPGYEGYGGIVARRGSYWRWNPWKYDSLLWQVRRGVPRRVMYKGSGIPIFHFDLVNMEDKSIKENITIDGQYFRGELFLNHYYRYFFSLAYFQSGDCKYPGDIPAGPEWDFSHLLNSYEYVTGWLQQMVLSGVLRIKDHAIDISDELNKIVALGGRDPITNDIFISDEIDTEVGGVTGYTQILNLFNVQAGALNAITPKMVKDKLLNSGGSEYLGPDGSKKLFRAFLPRRAILPPADSRPGATAWGFSGAAATVPSTTYTIQGAPSRINTILRDFPIQLSENAPDIFKQVLNPKKVVCGLYGNFVIDASGKIFGFGYDLESELYNSGGGYQCPDIFEIWRERVGCIPWYLDAYFLFNHDDPEGLQPQDPEYIPDGKVVDIAYQRDFAVAMVDFDNDGIFGIGPCEGEESQVAFTQAAEEYPVGYDFEEEREGGPNVNVNGPNKILWLSDTEWCAREEPFNPPRILVPIGVPAGPRYASTEYLPDGTLDFNLTYRPRNPNACRLKSWGYNAKKYGTFCGSNYQGIKNVLDAPSNCNDITFIEYVRTNSDVNPVINGFSRRYPGTNNHFIWTAISSGVKHFAAIDDYGGLFITPQSDNTFNQSSKGLGVTYSSVYGGFVEAGLTYIQNTDVSDFICEGHNGVGCDFNYYPHVPRPGYVKPEEWNQAFYNNITLPKEGGSVLYGNKYKQYVCKCMAGYTCGEIPGDVGGVGGAGGAGGSSNDPCAQRLYRLPSGEPGDTVCGESGPLPVNFKDATCTMMGDLVSYGLEVPDETGGYVSTTRVDTQPSYTKVDCGLYNTLCLTNENRLEIYGSYVRVDTNGEAVTGPTSAGFYKEIPCFIPGELLSKAGTWDITYACPINCQGATHSPILAYEYNPPSPGNSIKIIRSSGDYSLCITGDNVLHIWGEASMVPGAFDVSNYTPGNVAYRTIPLNDPDEIISVAAGVNSLYVHYTKVILINDKPARFFITYEYNRYNLDGSFTEVPDSIDGRKIIDMDAGLLHAVALSSTRELAKTWRAEDFAEGTLSFQFKNFSNLPYYLRRQAFFHALPGGWDYSKWLYGGICCGGLDNPGSNPVYDADPCSALAYNIYNNNSFDEDIARSGNPHYFWMRQDWRRNTTQSLVDMKGGQIDPDNPEACKIDLGLDLSSSNSNFSFMAATTATCLNTSGRAWADLRPTASDAYIRTTERIPNEGSKCQPIPCTDISTYRQYNPNVRYLTTNTGADLPPRVGYRATKDIFQKMTFFVKTSFGDASACAYHGSAVWSYFKYAERHNYLGYDSNNDVWKIYPNPDFLKEKSQGFNPLTLNPRPFPPPPETGNTGRSWYEYFYGICGGFSGDIENNELNPGCSAYVYDPECYGCTLFGFGGGNLPPVPPPGQTAGCCGYQSLKDYPQTGPNYGLDWIVETPVVIHHPIVQLNYNLSVDNSENSPNPNESCRGCLASSLPGEQIWRSFQPGGFQFDGTRGAVPGGQGQMVYAHLYNQEFRDTLLPKKLLKGVSTNFVTSTLPPDHPNTDVESISFKQVLFDSSKTQISKPWAYASSTKWIPICWKSPTILPFTSSDPLVLSIKPWYFNYSNILNAENPLLRELGTGYSDFSETNEAKYVVYKFNQILPINPEAPIDFQERKLDAFITRPNDPNLEMLQPGCFVFYIWARQFWSSNHINLFFKVFKISESGELTLIDETTKDMKVPATGVIADFSNDHVFGTPYDGKELKNYLYFDEPIPFNLNDRIYIELWSMGGEGSTASDFAVADNDAIEIMYENKSFLRWNENDGGSTFSDILKYSRVEYQRLVENSSQICFGGFDENDNLPNSNTFYDPNIVILEYDSEGRPVVRGSPVSCNNLSCCD